jgi:hypothetical protein
MLLRLACLGITNAFALLRLLPGSDRDKDAEILALRHQLAVLHRQLGGQRVQFEPADRARLAALLSTLPRPALQNCRNAGTAVSPAGSSRAGSPTATRRPTTAGSGRLISRSVDSTGAGERHRRRCRTGRLRWRPLRRRDLGPGDRQGERDLVEQALRHSGVDLEVSADANIGRGRQVHDVVAGERISSESTQPPRELLDIDHLQPHRRIVSDPP